MWSNCTCIKILSNFAIFSAKNHSKSAFVVTFYLCKLLWLSSLMETCFMNALKAFSFSKKTRFFTEYLAFTNIAVSGGKSAAATFFKLTCSLKSTIFLPDWQNLTFKLCWVIGNILFYAYSPNFNIRRIWFCFKKTEIVEKNVRNGTNGQYSPAICI